MWIMRVKNFQEENYVVFFLEMRRLQNLKRYIPCLSSSRRETMVLDDHKYVYTAQLQEENYVVFLLRKKIFLRRKLRSFPL